MTSGWRLEPDGTIVRSPRARFQPIARFARGATVVSTVFLGVDRGGGEEAPHLFETAIIGPGLAQFEIFGRGATRAEAAALHTAAVARVEARTSGGPADG